MTDEPILAYAAAAAGKLKPAALKRGADTRLDEVGLVGVERPSKLGRQRGGYVSRNSSIHRSAT